MGLVWFGLVCVFLCHFNNKAASAALPSTSYYPAILGSPVQASSLCKQIFTFCHKSDAEEKFNIWARIYKAPKLKKQTKKSEILVFFCKQFILTYTELDLQPAIFVTICNFLRLCCNSVSAKVFPVLQFFPEVLYEYDPCWPGARSINNHHGESWLLLVRLEPLTLEISFANHILLRYWISLVFHT